MLWMNFLFFKPPKEGRGVCFVLFCFVLIVVLVWFAFLVKPASTSPPFPFTQYIYLLKHLMRQFELLIWTALFIVISCFYPYTSSTLDWKGLKMNSGGIEAIYSKSNYYWSKELLSIRKTLLCAMGLGLPFLHLAEDLLTSIWLPLNSVFVF